MISKSIILWIWMLNVALCFAQQPIQFKHLTVDEGMVSNHVKAILKDSKGFVWFGTSTGLSRYDGHRFRSYANIPNDKTSLINNSILGLFLGFDQQLWVRTTRGSCIYDIRKDAFVWNVDSALQAKGFVQGRVKKIITTKSGAQVLYENGDLYFSSLGMDGERAQLWKSELSGKLTDIYRDSVRQVLLVVSDNGQLLELDDRHLRLQRQTSFLFDRVVENPEFQLFVDNSSGVWVHAKNFPFGALHYSVIGLDPTIFRQQEGTNAINNNHINTIQQLDDAIWMATDHGGVNMYDLRTRKIHYLIHDRFDNFSLPYNSTTALYKDDQGIMWVGTYKGGASYYHSELNFFSLFQHQVGRSQSLPFNDINCFVEDKEGMVWIGTNGGGLVRFDPKNQTFISYVHNAKDESSLGSNVVVSLSIDHDDVLWVGTYYGGLNKFEGGKFKRFLHSPSDVKSINDNSVWTIFQDSRDRFWIGMLYGGVDLMDRSSNYFYRHKIKTPSTYNSKIIEDSKGNIWIGTSNGVARLSPDNQMRVFDEQSTPYPLTNNLISDMLEDRLGRIWVATQTGINIISDEQIIYLSSAKGLIDNVVVGLVMDNYGDIWATTPKGVSHIQNVADMDSYTIQSYDKSDGLQASNFNERAAYKLKDGRLLFGGSEGFNMYTPKSIHPRNYASIAVVDFRFLASGIVEEPTGVLIKKWLSSTAEGHRIQVPHQVHTFTLVLSDFDFMHTQKAKIQYQLKGLSNEWIDLDNMEITFANLRARDYELLVREVDQSKATSFSVSLIEISVLTPWWRTHLAYGVYTLLVLGILLFFRKMEKKRARSKYNMMQIEEKARHTKELEELRTRFFTNVSHEFRTPISLIISPIQQLKAGEHDAKKTRYLDIIERNASSLLDLVNQLLDFNKIENQNHALTPTFGDIATAVRHISEQFENVAEGKGITYGLSISKGEWGGYIDFEKLERIVLNLLSNAFKFTSRGGRVDLVLGFDHLQKVFSLEVKDTGVGVAKEAQQHVFDRYYQVNEGKVATERGSGLGLSIVKEFVEIMGGEVMFKSEEGEGTTVVVLLPIGTIDSLSLEDDKMGKKDVRKGDQKHNTEKSKGGNLLRILVVEDHEDYAFYLTDNLRNYFHVETHSSVEEARKHILKFHPDLIVSDLHLNGASGMEFCREIRANDRTKHIPFVLITATGEKETQLEALKSGVSDFLHKPFNLDVFISKLQGLLERQVVVEKLYKRQIDVKVSPAEVHDEDERFMLKLTSVTEQHLQDNHFSVEVLASHMNITRVGLYKKVLSITGYTPTEYIRNIRLNKALDLLKNSRLTISEIAYEVGFGHPKQFTKYFKAFYGDVPSSFRK